LYLSLNTSSKQFVERLNDLNYYHLYFPEENSKQFDQGEIWEILNQTKARDSEWHEAMVNANIDILEMSYEENVSYFKRLENLKKQTHQRSRSCNLSKQMIVIQPSGVQSVINFLQIKL
jgi:hypothetical protein